MPLVEYPGWLDDLRHRRADESAGEHIARIVRGLDGCSLTHDSDKLAALFLCNETEAKARLVSSFKTNCGTSMREILCLAGCDHRLVIEPYVAGMAVAWVLQAARELDALVVPSAWRDMGPGWGCWYGTPGFNDDHLEWCLAVPQRLTGLAEHGGGGRSANEISVEPASDIRFSRGRPLRGIIDPGKMCLNPSRGDDEY